ncbi:MAG: PQQ-binding-like beta-propeller repeat protein, partial [Ktedonobacteraceae bacterium]|nr:PQQ-binding-like beta-propeller repeat protein [Ktedonobacteraceae bacterium]
MRSSRRVSHHAITCTIISFLALVISLISGTGNVLASSSLSAGVRQATGNAVAANNTAVTTYKEDTARTGNHSTETILNTNNVKESTFGKRVTYAVDGQIYAQPLFLPNIIVGGTSHNVVYVATEHDSIYAFDADSTRPIAPLWRTSFINPPRVVPPSNVDLSCNDMIPEDGLSGTPVIDRSTGTLYVVVLTKENGSFVYRLHALDITTGREKAGSPTVIQASVPGRGAGSVNGRVAFLPQRERQRASPLIANGKIYIAWGSFCDNDPYHGWIMSYSYDGSRFQQVNVYADTANSTRGGIWGAGGAMSADSNGNIYYVSGNGGFDANTGGSDYGDSFVKLNAQLQVQDYFAPFNQQCLDAEDADLGSGGPLLLPGQKRIISAGKEGRIYVINTSNMGHYNTIADPCHNQGRTNVDRVVQELPPATIGGLFSNATYWRDARGQQYVYFAGAHDHTKAFVLNNNGTLATKPSSHTAESFGFTGGNPTISSNNGAAGTGILWTIDPTPALRAYDATNLGKELYNSTQNSARDGMSGFVKFTAPTVA